jgi:dTDP-4-amino-4,6-dideoxygalactose transaminase
VGASPYFVDIDEFYHMDVRDMEMFDKSLKAILFVDLYGQTPNIDKINKFAKTFDIKVIEDAAQSFGSEYKGKKVGSLVDLTCFSFNPVKNLGAMGDAGAVTGSKELVEKVRMYRDHGRKTKFEYDTVGYNARIDNLQAVIVQAKLKKIDAWLDKKREICRRYTKQLDGIVKCPKEAPWSKHTYYVYVIQTPEGTRDELQQFLKEKGIATNIHYKFPTHKTKAFLDNEAELPKTEYACENILSLPCYHTLPEHHQDYVINAIKEFYAD